ncbi:PKD domain-containing protein [Kinneretia aquatilis]|uniref:PKD domain-containing protein n=1 Tax=Kinneretia aquatilis TaxID=2070761 RepID=UPI0014953668|nr:PKD domain-containing protein [Paucibacter aquatile]WIV97651.1 PKD domain-containing protein [Paucibacter aquatile]
MKIRAFGVGVLLALVSMLAAASETRVGTYTQVSSKRVNATIWEFVLKARLSNSGAALSDVKATVKSSDPSFAVVEDQLEFGEVAAGATVTSRDTFTIRIDRSKPLDESKLVWTVTSKPLMQAEFTVTPNGAAAPSLLKFKPATVPAIVRYEWDFNGDGLVDVSDESGAEQAWAYRVAGTYAVRLTVRDAQGHVSSKVRDVAIIDAALVIGGLSPTDTTLPAFARPAVTANFSDPAGIDSASVRLLVNGNDVTAQTQVSAQGVSYTPAQALAEGPYTVMLTVANRQGTSKTAVWGFDVAAPRSYSVQIRQPGGASTVTSPSLSVLADVTANSSYASRVTLNDTQMQQTGLTAEGAVQYAGVLDLVPGKNTVTVAVQYEDGERRVATTEVNYSAPARITITSPADKAALGRAQASSPGNLTGTVERPTLIAGRLSAPVATVTINQQAAELDASGLNFSFPRFFLHEGANLINVVATDAGGRVSTASISVSVDQTAPILNVESPRAGTITRAAWVDVRGMVNDAVEAIFGAPEPQVFISVNDQAEQAATVADRYFLLSRLALSEGLNRIKVRALDHLGNERVQTLDVHRADTGLAGLLIVDGHDQTGPGRTELPKPLTVLALDKDGEPVKDLAVEFLVERGTGSLSPNQGRTASGDANYSARAVSVRTDAQGRAAVWFRSGKQAGPGANLVRATSPLLGGEGVLFTANSQRGTPAILRADLGLNQISETDAPVMEILSAVVRDNADNHLPNVKVEFRVTEGKAFFVDQPGAFASADGQSIVLSTDKNGLVGVRPYLGSEPGIVRIAARAALGEDFNDPNGTVGGASFVIRAKKASDGPASFGGFVYSDKGVPLEGVKVSIGRTPLLATTDDKGYFEIGNVPPGRIDLFVDGRAVNPSNDPSKPQWPSLHFEAYVVRGQKNELPHAIYLPALLVGEAKVVGGNEDVVLTIPGLEGFSMKVKANSVTFPDGSRTGTLVVSPVTADKLPMAPPAGGAQFGVPAWTIQPAGTRFDPPIEVQMPNSTLEEPGDNLPVVQWDHDLGQYVPMGRATVSADGAWLVTDAGSGVTKAGWGGLCRYDDCKTAATKCRDCEGLVKKGNCYECQYDGSGGPFAKTSQSIDRNLNDWGPSGALKSALRELAGIEISLSAKVKGERVNEPSCCDRKKAKEEKQSGQGSLAFEGAMYVAIGEATPIGRVLATFKTEAFIRGKVGGAGAVSFDTDYCKEPGKQDVVEVSASAGGALELGLRFGNPDPGPGPVTGVGLEGYGGVDLQAAVKNKIGPTEFELERVVNAYVQLDVVFASGSMTLVKRSWELSKCDNSCMVSASPLIR